jgi:hypothetical protein
MAKTNLEAFSFALLWANASEGGRLVPYLVDRLLGCRNGLAERKGLRSSKSSRGAMGTGTAPDSRPYWVRGAKPFLRASLSTTGTKSLMRGSFLPLM